MNSYIVRIICLLAALLLQVLLFNHLSLWGGVAFVYVIALLKLPFSMNRSVDILVGFMAGFFVDLFCNTHGMHALAAGTMMLLRVPILNSFIRDKGKELKTLEVSFSDLDASVFMRFMLTILVAFAVILYFIEAFTFFNALITLTKVVISVLMTWCFALLFEHVSTKS